ncbi:MAG TPA: metallopeptidase TldD-related protein, partial [Spirochaetia bacterium]|nr:metallopeptidase TldD-related protein [Spirochaetia bacterium]
TEPDLDAMYDRLKEFVGAVKAGYPSTILEQGILDFTFRNSLFLNSNGVDFETNHGAYNCGAMFTTREGRKTSSFNYSGFSTKDLEKEIIECGSLRTLLAQSSEQTDLRAIGGKFTGEVIVTPDCLADFVGYFTGTFLSDQALISGTSILKDKLGGQVAHENLTLHSRPRSRELAENYFVTGDGYRAEDSTIVDRGVLKTFLLSLYGARKTGRDRAVNNGGAFIVEPGERSFEEITGSVKRGLLLCRFSGGSPADNGDFSGVAKNSYSIENGKILHPVSETMISGNLLSFFKSIRAVSRERINFGSAIYPWVCVSDLTISGK